MTYCCWCCLFEGGSLELHDGRLRTHLRRLALLQKHVEEQHGVQAVHTRTMETINAHETLSTACCGVELASIKASLGDAIQIIRKGSKSKEVLSFLETLDRKITSGM